MKGNWINIYQENFEDWFIRLIVNPEGRDEIALERGSLLKRPTRISAMHADQNAIIE